MTKYRPQIDKLSDHLMAQNTICLLDQGQPYALQTVTLYQ